jgi:hypothetical protein
MNTKIMAVVSGFYFFGTEVDAPEGYVALVDAAMFGGFKGGKGLPGVARGDKSATVTLDQFQKGKEVIFPITSVVAIMPSIDLYTFKGTTLR